MIGSRSCRFSSKLHSFLCLQGRVDGFSLIELVMVILLVSIAVPGLVGLYTSVLTNSHTAEILTVAELLAVEQMEIILTHKAGSGVGYGYASITAGRYSSVNPAAPFDAYTRTVNVQSGNWGALYPFKLITVTVNHDLINPITLSTVIFDHSTLPPM